MERVDSGVQAASCISATKSLFLLGQSELCFVVSSDDADDD